MNPLVPKTRPPRKCHGGKAYLARRIVELLPDHDSYGELYAGAVSVLLNKPEAPRREVINDLDVDAINLLRVIRSQYDDFAKIVRRTDYTEKRFNKAKRQLLDTPSCFSAVDYEGDLARAVEYCIACRFSRGGLREDFAWSDRLRGGQPGDINAWLTWRAADLPRTHERLQSVEMLTCDAMKMLRRFTKNPRALLYLDPPYLIETRSVVDTYARELTTAVAASRRLSTPQLRKAKRIARDRDQHRRLLEAIVDADCMIALSGYDSLLYREMLDDSPLMRRRERWRRVEFDMPNHSGQGKSKQRRVEVLWMNYPASKMT